MNSVNETTFTFIMQQIRTQSQKPHARRFTLGEKILCLSLPKSSGKGFRMLTLTNLLNKIPYRTGINKNIFVSI